MDKTTQFNGTVNDIESKANKAVTINANSDDSKYPSAKAVFEHTKQALSNCISPESNTEWIFDGGDASGAVEIDIVVDGEMSDTSDNPVSNKVVKNYIDSNIEKVNENVSAFKEVVTEELDSIADYGFETGTDGIWTYKKWNNGNYEATYLHSSDNEDTISLITEYGSVYLSETASTYISPPSFSTEITYYGGAGSTVTNYSGLLIWLNNEQIGWRLWSAKPVTDDKYRLSIRIEGKWEQEDDHGE